MLKTIRVIRPVKYMARFVSFATVLLLPQMNVGIEVNMLAQGPPPCSANICNNDEDTDSADDPNSEEAGSSPSCALSTDELSNLCFQLSYKETVNFLLQSFCVSMSEIETPAEDLQRIVVLCQNACVPPESARQQGRIILDSDWSGYLVCDDLHAAEADHMTQVDALILQYVSKIDAERLRKVLEAATSLIHVDSKEPLRLAIDSYCIDSKFDAASAAFIRVFEFLVSQFCSIASGGPATTVEEVFRDLGLQETDAIVELSNPHELEILNLLGLVTRTAIGCWTKSSVEGCGPTEADDRVTGPTAIRTLQSILGCMIASGRILLHDNGGSSSVSLSSGDPQRSGPEHKDVIDILSTSNNRKKACLLGAIATLAYNESDLDFLRR